MFFLRPKQNKMVFKYSQLNDAMFCVIGYERYFDGWSTMGISILNSMVEDSKLFMLSQYYDERLKHLQNSFGFTLRIKDEYALEMISTVDFDSKEKSNEHNDDYIIHFKGHKAKNVLFEIMKIGGSSLNFILYSNPMVSDEWFDTIIHFNTIVKKWFWLKAPNETVIALLDIVDSIHLTSDNDLLSIIPVNKMDSCLEVVSETAKRNDISLSVRQDEHIIVL